MAKRILFHGTMNAGKSAQLLIQAFNLEKQGKSLVIFKSVVDTRDKCVVKSRALDEEREAIPIGEDEVGKMYNYVKQNNPDFVFVDELQFMTPEQVKELADISIALEKPIFAYGLMLSYTGEIFNGTKKAIECGFTLHELKMQCDFCDAKSTHHLLYIEGKVVADGEQIHVGDQEYKSACYSCYKIEVGI
jgi:thymidine kinase